MRRNLRAAGALLVVVCVAACVPPAPSSTVDDARSYGTAAWPDFSPRFVSDSTGCRWTVEDSVRHCVTTALERIDGRSVWHVTYLRHENEAFTAEKLLTVEVGRDVESTLRLGGAAIMGVGDELFVALEAHRSGAERENLLLFYRLDNVRQAGIDLERPDGRLDIPLVERSTDWSAIRVATRTWLLAARGRRLEAVELGIEGTQVTAGEPWTLAEANATIATPAAIYDAEANELVVSWQEFADGNEAWVRVGRARSPMTGVRVAPSGATRIGFAAPFRGSSRGERTFLGLRVSFESRRSLAVARVGGAIVVATSRVTRERSQLSTFHVQPVVVVFDEFAERGSPAGRVLQLDEEQPGSVESSFCIAWEGDTLDVVFLREQPGEPVRSSVRVAKLNAEDALAVGSGTSELLSTPRRVVSPCPTGAANWGILWLQADPLNDAWQAAYVEDTTSAVGRLGIPWRGSTAETIAVALVGVPVAGVLSVYWAFVANSTVIGLAAMLAVGLFGFAPGAVRRHLEVVTVALIALAVAATGEPWLALGGPRPGIVAKGLVLVSMGWWAAKDLRRAGVEPRPGRVTLWCARSVLAAVSLSSYPVALALLE